MFKAKEGGNVFIKSTIRLLEEEEILEVEFQPHHKGNFLLEYVCDQLEVTEKDYFGIRFVDSSKQRHWLDLAKSIIKQVKDIHPLVLSFRVKFYPADPIRMTINGKCTLYQQLKRDLVHGRLYCSTGEAAALGALIVQDDCGDFDSEIHQGDYVANLRLALRQTDSLEKKIMDLHQKREPGQERSMVFDEFIGIARSLETYGVDPHPVKDHRGTQLYLGINYSGICTFAAGKRTQHFRWPEVQKLNFEGKMFIVHLSYIVDRETKKHTVGFKCPSGVACRYVWRCAIEQMLFFTLPTSQHASVQSGGGFFSWGAKFRYSGRTEREIMSESLHALKEKLNTSPSKRKANSVPATPSSPKGDLTDIRYSSLPRSTMSEPLGGCMDQVSSVYNPDATLLETVCEETFQRRHHVNGGESTDHLSDYYFRDSCESGVNNIAETRLGSLSSTSRSYAQTTLLTSDQSTVPLTVQQNIANTMITQNAENYAKSVKKFSIINAFIPSFCFVVVVLIISAVFVLESDSDLFVNLKNWPEMICLRYQYYQPLKEFIANKIDSIF